MAVVAFLSEQVLLRLLGILLKSVLLIIKTCIRMYLCTGGIIKSARLVFVNSTTSSCLK